MQQLVDAKANLEEKDTLYWYNVTVLGCNLGYTALINENIDTRF